MEMSVRTTKRGRGVRQGRRQRRHPIPTATGIPRPPAGQEDAQAYQRGDQRCKTSPTARHGTAAAPDVRPRTGAAPSWPRVATPGGVPSRRRSLRDGRRARREARHCADTDGGGDDEKDVHELIG
ncbi:unnamed protein product [Vitrella brassicaformis CCMP3155]|uniref:Uncharacterized protein n=1 Tax=Vitrella brassicaformis (strain CCMP3155) TaxID=1169540 RepID=A0A0G4E9Y5_VITBC|nr:unnamed protein product [Vitrella brassicaformis CCMP3155]|eukprot:CEL92020.1 unnamed protein product [Vitrella brassicaformis CCMP3155]